jgi:hypothetical protein
VSYRLLRKKIPVKVQLSDQQGGVSMSHRKEKLLYYCETNVNCSRLARVKTQRGAVSVGVSRGKSLQWSCSLPPPASRPWDGAQMSNILLGQAGKLAEVDLVRSRQTAIIEVQLLSHHSLFFCCLRLPFLSILHSCLSCPIFVFCLFLVFLFPC